MKLRSIFYDEEFLINMSEDFMRKFICLDDVIPMRINSIIMDYIPNWNIQRLDFIGDNDKFISKIREERFIARSLPSVERREYHNNLALDFIERHPEFAPIIKEVKYIDVWF